MVHLSPVDQLTFSAELLKAHRQNYLFQKHGMVQIPLLTPALVERFDGQVACTSVLFPTFRLIGLVLSLTFADRISWRMIRL